MMDCTGHFLMAFPDIRGASSNRDSLRSQLADSFQRIEEGQK